MLYLQDSDEITASITEYAQAEILWIDTETADFLTRKPKLSLIQILADRNDVTGDKVSVLDVLEHPEAGDRFIKEIMLNSKIQKVFHNAKYDIKFLGKSEAKNVTCTLEMAKAIPYYILQLPDFSLKTLTEKLCNITEVDKSQQSSDWGQRPLSQKQLNYAKMDPVYVAMIHQQLLHLKQLSSPNPATEDLSQLAQRYVELKQQLQLIDSEFTHVETRLKSAMQVQNVAETDDLKLSQSSRKSLKVEFEQLAEVILKNQLSLDLEIALTQKLQKQIGNLIEQLNVKEATSTSWRLSVKKPGETDSQNEELEF